MGNVFRVSLDTTLEETAGNDLGQQYCLLFLFFLVCCLCCLNTFRSSGFTHIRVL